MEENTNVVQLFEKEDSSTNATDEVREDTSQSTANIVNKEKLESHESFSYDNVLAALIANRYILEDKTTKQEWLNSREHTYSLMLEELYQYVYTHMDSYVAKSGCTIEWGSTTNNSLSLIQKSTGRIIHEFHMELYVTEDYTTEILILDEDGGISAWISNDTLSTYEYRQATINYKV